MATSKTESNAHLIYVSCAIFALLCPLLVGTRLWSRKRKGGSLGADDYTILASEIFCLVSIGIMLTSCYYGYGRHVADLNAYDKGQALKYFYMCQITYKLSINLTKSSILLLYMRIFCSIRWSRWICTGLITIIGMYCTITVFVTIFQCSPIQRAWNKDLHGNCIDNAKFWYANGSFSIATDIIILAIPMPLVYALKIPRVQKAALIFVFTLGFFVVITSCLRFTTLNLQATSPDPTWDIASTMWTIIEMNVSVICACLPQIRPLIVKLFPKLMPASYGQGRSDKRPPFDSGLTSPPHTHPYLNHDSTWIPIESKDAINLTKVRKGETFTEEDVLQDDKAIQKTVGYSVEYSRKRSKEAKTSV